MSQANSDNSPKKLVIDPLTRIEGHLRLEVEIADGKVSHARCMGTLFRGLEIILQGRDPFDAPHFTQRVCGVCTYTHALASTRALEMAINKPIPHNATYIRNLVLAMIFLHDHIVHYFVLSGLDYIDIMNALQADPAKAAALATSISNRKVTADDYRAVQAKLRAFVDSGQLGPFTNAYFLGGHPAYVLSPELNLIGTADYLEALRVQVKVARAMAVFGGKNPHTQFLVGGGVTCYDALSPKRISEFRQLYQDSLDFVENIYIPDLLAIGAAYRDSASYGGGARNLMAFGEFPAPGGELNLDSRWLPAGVIRDRNFSSVEKLDLEKIAEGVSHSWYRGTEALHPYEGRTEPEFTSLEDSRRYSWMKAPRYGDEVVETGPLAQILVAAAGNHPVVRPVLDWAMNKLGLDNGNIVSTLGRTLGRGLEALVIARQTEAWLRAYEDNIRNDRQIVENYVAPKDARGVGVLNAPRGGLSHWLVTDASARIANFQMVVPTTWNLSPRDERDVPGACEQALVGTPVADPARPVEILRTVHSFDPCVACAVHVIDPRSNEVRKFRLL